MRPMKSYDDEAVQDPERVLAEVAHTDLVLADINSKIMSAATRQKLKIYWGLLYADWLFFRSENPLIVRGPRVQIDARFIEATFERSRDFRARGLKIYDVWKTEAAQTEKDRLEGEARERAGGMKLEKEAQKAAQGPEGKITTARIVQWTLGIAAALGGIFVGQRVWKGWKESEDEKKALRKAEREQKRALRLDQLRTMVEPASARLLPEAREGYAAAAHEYGAGNGHVPPPTAFAMLGTGSSDLEALNAPPAPYQSPASSHRQLGPHEPEDETMPPMPGPY